MLVKFLCLAFGLVATLFSAAACAQDEGGYLGAGVGASKANNFGSASSCPRLQGLVLSSCSVLDDSGTGWKVFGGYRMDRYVAIEVSVVDFGKFKASASGTVISPTVDSSESRAYGAEIGMIFSIPLSREFSVFARGGLLGWTAKSTISRSIPSLPSFTFSEDRKATGQSFTFGVGAGYDSAENTGFRLEWQRFMGIGDEGTTGRADIDLATASFVYRFR